MLCASKWENIPPLMKYFGQKYINKIKPDSIKPQNSTANLW